MFQSDILIKKLACIENIRLTNISIGVAPQNKIILEILDAEDIMKWEYFIERLSRLTSDIIVKRDYPYLSFLFYDGKNELLSNIEHFETCVDKKYYLIEKPEAHDLTLIMKITNLCNLDCRYCYDRPFRERLGHNGVLSREKLERAVDLASRYAENVTLLWHGGEPTLAGIEYYRSCYDELLPKYPYTEFTLAMQTNGTLLNDDWFDFFKDTGTEVGTSYSATEEVLRETRADNDSRVQGCEVDTVIKNVQAAAKKGLDIGVIDVLTKKNHHKVKEIYDFYKNNNISVSLNAISDAGEAEKHDFLFDTPADRREYKRVTEDYFLYWATDKSEAAMPDRYASFYMQLLLIGDSCVCKNSNTCVNKWAGINSNGDIYPCDRALPAKYRMGNVTQFKSFYDAFNTREYKVFRAERIKKLESCKKHCPLFDYCKGGCPMEDIDSSGSAEGTNRYACKIFFINLMAAYNALLKTELKDLNRSLRRFIIDKALFLPREIPEVMRELGLEKEIEGLDFTREIRFSDKEFELFRAINPPEQEMQAVSGYDSLSFYTGEDGEDNRLMIFMQSLKNRADALEKELKEKKDE